MRIDAATATAALIDAAPMHARGTARERLTQQLTLLEDSRPSFSAARGLLLGGAGGVAGGLLAIAGASALLSTGGSGYDGLGERLIGLLVGFVGVALGIAGGVLLIVGLVKLLWTASHAAENDAQTKELRHRIDELDREAAPTPIPTADRTGIPQGFVLVRF